MSFLLSNKKVLMLGFLIILLIAIPLSVYMAQKQQQTKSRAALSTSLSFSPSTLQATKIGEVISFDIMLDPSAGQPPNQVSFAKLIINFDALKLATSDAGLVPNTAAFPSVLEDPTYSTDVASVTLSIGADPIKAIKTKTKIATISFKTLAPSDGTKITFGNSTQILSIASGDQASENVLLLSSLAPATVTITDTSPSPSPVPTLAAINNALICTSLGLDRSATGSAPYSITFTGSGNNSAGTITKATFNFGDGPVADVTQGGNLGTKSVSVQISHTYRNPGAYTASVIFTDNTGSLSALSSNCTQAITINPPGTATPTIIGGPGATGAAETPVPSLIVEGFSPTPPTSQVTAPPLQPPGPSEKIIGIGIVGAILSIIGGILFFTL